MQSPLPELVPQRCQDRLPFRGVSRCLLGVVADDVAAPLHPCLFHLQILRHLVVAARPREHLLAYLPLAAQPRPQDVFSPRDSSAAIVPALAIPRSATQHTTTWR